MIEIKNRFTGSVLIKVDAPNLRDADLRDADLCDANLYAANLRGANLRGANLRCAGNMSEVFTAQFDTWQIGWTKDTLQVGCQRHAIEKWRKWETDAGKKWIASMDSGASAWAEKYMLIVLQLIDKTVGDK